VGIILFITALILTSISFLISIVFTPIAYLISFKWKSGIKALNRYFLTLAISIDQFGNGATKEVLNRILIKRSSVKNSETQNLDQPESIKSLPSMDFGDIDLTVSYVIGVNKYRDNLTLFGKLVERLLHLIDPNHVEKALENQYHKDKESRERLKRPFFYYHR
jgi:hypothetical protein